MGELRYDGRVAVITGAGRGLGRGYALLLGARGAKVVVNDVGAAPTGQGRSADPAEAVVEEIRAAGGEAVADFGDAGSQDDAEAMVARALEAFGRVDVVIANAGGVETVDPFGEMSRASFDSMVRTHLGGSFAVSRAAWPHMAGQGFGRIVLTSSYGAFGTERLAHYCAAKAGVLGLMRALSVEGPPLGIQANAIMPGAMTRLMANTNQARESGETAPIRGHMPPDIVAPAVAWLAHEACRLNGEMVGASGGFVGRTFYGLTAGFGDPALTIEQVRDHWAQIDDKTGYTVAATIADARDVTARRLAQAASA